MKPRQIPIAGHPDAIVIDTIGKMHEHRQTLHAFRADCAARYRPERTRHNSPRLVDRRPGGAHRRARSR